MIKAVEYLDRWKFGFFRTEDVLRMALRYPYEFLWQNQKKSPRYGRLKKNYQASLTIIPQLLGDKPSRSLKVITTMIDGKWVYKK